MLTHVATLRSIGLVTDRQPITMEAKDGTFVEVFEWASAEAIHAAHSHPVVLKMWEEYGKACDSYRSPRCQKVRRCSRSSRRFK